MYLLFSVYLCIYRLSKQLRSDCGTENTMLATAHMALRHNHMDEFSGTKSFWHGSSTTNSVSCLCNSLILSYFLHRELKVGGLS